MDNIIQLKRLSAAEKEINTLKPLYEEAEINSKRDKESKAEMKKKVAKCQEKLSAIEAKRCNLAYWANSKRLN